MDLLVHWQKKIKEYNLNIKLNPEPGDVSLDPVIAMKRMHNICFTVFEHPFINLDGFITPCGRLQHINLENVIEKGFDAYIEDYFDNKNNIQRWRVRIGSFQNKQLAMEVKNKLSKFRGENPWIAYIK